MGGARTLWLDGLDRPDVMRTALDAKSSILLPRRSAAASPTTVGTSWMRVCGAAALLLRTRDTPRRVTYLGLDLFDALLQLGVLIDGALEQL